MSTHRGWGCAPHGRPSPGPRNRPPPAPRARRPPSLETAFADETDEAEAAPDQVAFSPPPAASRGRGGGAGHRDACGAGRRAGAEAGQGHEAACQDAPAASRGGRGLPGTSPRPSWGARPAGARRPSREPAAAATRKLPTFVSLRQPWELMRAHTRVHAHTRAHGLTRAQRQGQKQRLLHDPLSLSTRFQPTASQNPMTMTVSQTQAARTTQQHHRVTRHVSKPSSSVLVLQSPKGSGTRPGAARTQVAR